MDPTQTASLASLTATSFGGRPLTGASSAVASGPGASSSNAYRTPATCSIKGFEKSDNFQQPPKWYFSEQDLARRWATGIGVGAGGYIIVRPLPAPALG